MISNETVFDVAETAETFHGCFNVYNVLFQMRDVSNMSQLMRSSPWLSFAALYRENYAIRCVVIILLTWLT